MPISAPLLTAVQGTSVVPAPLDPDNCPRHLRGTRTTPNSCPGHLRGTRTTPDNCQGHLRGTRTTPDSCPGHLRGTCTTPDSCPGHLRGICTTPDNCPGYLRGTCITCPSGSFVTVSGLVVISPCVALLQSDCDLLVVTGADSDQCLNFLI